MVGVWDIGILHINCEDLSNHFQVCIAHAKIKSKPREIFTEEYGTWLMKLKCANTIWYFYKYGKIMWDLTAHKITARIYQLNFENAGDSNNL